MNDLLLIISVTIGTYLCCVGFAIILIRLFFPFMTNEEMERIRNRSILGETANRAQTALRYAGIIAQIRAISLKPA